MPESVPLPLKGQLENVRQLERQVDQLAKRASKNLKIDFTGSRKNVDSLSQPLGRLSGKADEFTKSMEAANARVLAFGASVGVVNAVVQSFKTLVSTTIEVEKSLAKINSILNTNVTGLNKLKNQIFDIAKNTEQTFDTVAEAALELSRQGLSATEVTKRLNDSLILSRLAGIDASEAVAGLTAAVNSFSKSGLTTGEVLNKISAAANKFAVSERDLIEGFKRSASVAQQAGVSIDELGGIITAVQQKTARGGAVIGNSFKTIFTRIGRAENLKLLTQIGVQVTDLEGKILPATQLIENLAGKLEDLNDVQVRSVTEKIGGGFQIAPLLAALSDYSSETSIAIQATEAFSNATNEAYKKNEIQNKTLSAAINTTSLSVKELANSLGELGVIDVFKDLLGSLNSFIGGVKNVLDGDSIGSTFAKGIVTGLSSILIKGGLALFTLVIGKLAIDLAKFGSSSLKTFFGINNEAERLKNIQQQITSTLLSDKNVRKDILSIEQSSRTVEEARARQAQYFTTALTEQLSIMQKMQAISVSIAPTVGASATRISKSRSTRAAGGFLPVGAEQRDINSGVGGAPSGAKPVVIPNFAFGGGQRGTMVANSSEYIVPNFAGGGSAIFNQDMVKSIGLPSGARKINAAGGFIPNFAGLSSLKPTGSRVGDLALLLSRGATVRGQSQKGFGSLNAEETNKALAKSREKAKKAKKAGSKSNLSSNLSVNGRRYGIASIATDLKGGNETPFDIAPKPLSSFASSSSLSSPTAKALIEQGYDTISFRKVQVKSLQKNELQNAVEKNRNRLFDYFLQPLASYGKDLLGGSGLFKGNDLNDAAKIIDTKNNKKLFSKAAEGGIFESAVDLITKGISGLPSIGDSENSPFDFEETGSASSELKKAFGFSDALKKADAKRTASTSTVGSIAGKALRDGEESSYIKSLAKRRLKSVAKKASTGYIPNYANGGALEEAIQREKDAGVPINQIRINQDGKLRNSQNPNGIAITNTRDEPTGAIPKNAAKGFMPNFVKNKSKSTSSDIGDAAEVSTGKLLLLSSAAQALNQGLSSITEESNEVTKRLGSLSSGIFGAISTLTLLQGLGVNVAGGKLFSKLGGVGKKFSGLGKGLAGLLPIVGKAVIGFQLLNAGLKLFDIDLFKKVQESLGLIETPFQKAAKSAEKFSDELLKQTGKIGGVEASEKSLAETRKRAEIERAEADAKRSGRDFKEEDFDSVFASVFSRTLGREKLDFRDDPVGRDPQGNLRFQNQRVTTDEAEAIRSIFKSEQSKTTAIIGGFLDQSKFAEASKTEDTQAFAELISEVETKIGDKRLQKLRDLQEDATQAILNEDLEEELAIRKKINNFIKEIGKDLDKNNKKNERGLTPIKTISAEIAKIRRQDSADNSLFLNNIKSQEQIQQEILVSSKLISEEQRLQLQFGLQATQNEKKLKDSLIKRTSSQLEASRKRLGIVGTGDESEVINKSFIQLQEVANKQLREKGKLNIESLLQLAKNNKLASVNQETLRGVLEEINEGNESLTKKTQLADAYNIKIAKEKKAIEVINKLEQARIKLIEQQLTESIKIQKINNEISNKQIQENQNRLSARFGTGSGISSAVDVAKIFSDQRIQNNQISNQSLGRFEGYINDLTATAKDFGVFNDSKVIESLQNLAKNRTQENLKVAGNTINDAAKNSVDAQTKFLTGTEKFAETGDLFAKAIELFAQLVTDPDSSLTKQSINDLKTIIEGRASKSRLPGSEGEKGAGGSLDVTGIQQKIELERKSAELAGAGIITPEEKIADERQRIINQRQLDFLKAKDNATRIQLEFEYQKNLDILKVYEEQAKLAKERGGKLDDKDILEFQKRVTSISARELPFIKEVEKILVKAPDEIDRDFKDSFLNASKTFKDSLVDGIQEAIVSGESLGDVLQNAAYNFAQAISKASFNKLADQIIGGSTGGGFFSGIGKILGFNQGGIVNGGSGSKDDVPAMLMGGEYVMKKSAVNKYGAGFMESINAGKAPSELKKFANGGLVRKEEKLGTQTGEGGFFIPGTYGGSIQGKQNLLDFATQSFTSGARDVRVSGAAASGGGGYSGVSLEAESVRLTNRGRKLGTPLQQATLSAKEQAFGLRTEQLNLEEQLKEQEKARKKAFKNQLISAGIGIVAGGLVSGFKLGAKNAGGLTGGFKDGIGAGLKQFGKGVFGGLKGSIFGGEIKGAQGTFGGLKNIFSARGGITNDKQLFEYIQKNPDSSLARNTDLFGTAPSRAFTVDSGPQTLAQAQRSSGFSYAGGSAGGLPERGYDALYRKLGNGLLPPRRATGGYVSETAGVDTVPTMLSGGEFVMNSAAADRVGRGNLEKMNSGVSEDGESKGIANEELLSKLDDLIEATKESTGEINITVNGEGGREEESGGQGGGNREFAKKLKEQVVNIIEEEKRLGGSLRNDKL